MKLQQWRIIINVITTQLYVATVIASEPLCIGVTVLTAAYSAPFCLWDATCCTMKNTTYPSKDLIRQCMFSGVEAILCHTKWSRKFTKVHTSTQ